jgi:HEAT repeat protein
MSEDFTSQTAPNSPDVNALDVTGLRKSVAVLVLNLVAATTLGARRCFLEETAVTQTVEILAESSTRLRRVTPEVQARLGLMLDLARREIIEDGKSNAITERLAEFFVKDFNAVIPALAALIANSRTAPVIAAEVLKELGRIRNAASHEGRRWILEHALKAPSPFVRDGAGLGLARLADPVALRCLRKAMEEEPNAQTRADLQLVVDELAETVR